ncbi:MAG: archaeal proteasome endopeptidase complex subunit alpha [Candidatus Aenigmarchaeota archaeon]|nr:archaeal proteasome endopeptidase complex subunit alpha [Candidatus Aenigmarchaeota archaeon]
MVEIMPEYMGYDRTIAVFSPDGRLFQVEYAKEAVKRGTTCLGIVFKDGVLLATVKPITSLMVSQSIEKIFKIDEHIGAVASGLLADARILANQARIKAQVHRITYDEPIDVWSLARVIGDRMQLSTLYAGLRPFGVSFLIGGTDKTGVHLIESDPSGMLYEWYAYAIGRGGVIANKILKQKWKHDLTEKEAIDLTVDIISKTEKEKKENAIDIAIIKKGERFKKLSEEEIKKILK